MKTYRGERTERGCKVTVDGKPLQPRVDLSGNTPSEFDWGYIGTGQLSLALLSDFLGNDPKAKALCEAFEKKVVAELPKESWTLTGKQMDTAIAPLVDICTPSDGVDQDGAAFGDMPVETKTH